MGDERPCTLRLAGRASKGKALLETDEILFRGDPRVVVPFRAITRVAAEDGVLVVETKDAEYAFEIGAAAAKWAEKIRNPKTLLQKLGVERGARVSVLGVKDAVFLAELASSGADVSTRARKESDAVFLAVEDAQGLARIGKMEPFLKPDGGLWCVHPKGRKDLRDVDVIAAGRRVGLTDNKVARFSDTHSALRFVIPRARRGDPR